MQATSSVSNRFGKNPKHPNQDKNNRRILANFASKQRNNSDRKVNAKSETHTNSAPSETDLVEARELHQAQFHNDDYEQEDITEHFQGSSASTANKTFKDNISIRNAADIANDNVGFIWLFWTTET